MNQLRRLTAFSFVAPKRFIDTTNPTFWRRVDIQAWSERFVWDQDPWSGLKDYVSHPKDTIQNGHGDCDDYAFAIATLLWHQTDSKIGIAYLFDYHLEGSPGHVVAYDTNTVYSSGEIYNMSIGDYAAQSRYDRLFKRAVRK